jgi:hypothetical protein
MERYLVELTGDQLDRLNGMVREAINSAEDKNKRELEDLLVALHDIRWKAGDRRSDCSKEKPRRSGAEYHDVLARVYPAGILTPTWPVGSGR